MLPSLVWDHSGPSISKPWGASRCQSGSMRRRATGLATLPRWWRSCRRLIQRGSAQPVGALLGPPAADQAAQGKKLAQYPKGGPTPALLFYLYKTRKFLAKIALPRYTH